MDRQQAHQLLDRLGPAQFSAVVQLLEVLAAQPESLRNSLALAPFDDEPFTAEDRIAVAEADEWLKHNKPIPLENVLADVGLTRADWETMGKSALPEDNGTPNA